MRVISLILFLPVFLFSGNINSNHNELKEDLKIQKNLMQFVIKYNKKTTLNEYRDTLDKIFNIYKKIKNKNKTLAFYTSLLESIKYKKLYSYIFYNISKFYKNKLRGKYLIKALRFSQTENEKQFILIKLYEYYKSKKISNLQLSYLLKLIDIQKVNKDFAKLKTSYNNLATFYKEKKDYLTALEHYFKALKYSKTVKNSQRGIIYLNISEVFRIINRQELAKKYLKKAMDYSIHNKDESLKVLVLSSYSRLCFKEKDYNNALKFINLSIKSKRKIKKRANIMNLYYNKSLILFEIGKIEKAMQLLRLSINTGLRNKKYENLLPIMTEYTEKLIEFERYSEADKNLKKIDDIYASYYPYYFFYYYLKAIYFEKKNDLTTSLRFYKKTINKLDQYFTSLNDYRYYSFRKKIDDIYSKIIEFYLKMFKQSKNKMYTKKALYFSEVKNYYVFELIASKEESYSHLLNEKKKVEEELLILNKNLIQLLNTDPHKETVNFYENKLDSLKKQYTELEELILEMPLKFKKYRFKDLNIHLIQQNLKSNQLIIKYILLNKNAYIFYIEKNSLGYIKLKAGTNKIVEMIRELTEPLDDFTRGNVDYLRINYNLELANQLYTILLEEVLKFHKNINEIYIIPDRELFKLPFEALVTGFNHRDLEFEVIFSEYSMANYIIQKYIVSYSLSLFHFQSKIPSLKRKKYTITAFGNPLIKKMFQKDIHPINSNIKIFNDIPSSKNEILSIRTIFGEENTRIFFGDKFNRKNFERYAPESKIVHIATHFINNINYPQHSALLFSPVGNSNPLYYAYRIFELKIGATLVVLSACESSEKNLLGLQGLRGMTASFRNSGVKSMIVSMWPVDDQSSKIVPLFYRKYKKSKNVSQSLREAKLELMKKITKLKTNLKISMSHPFLWANYILYNFDK